MLEPRRNQGYCLRARASGSYRLQLARSAFRGQSRITLDKPTMSAKTMYVACFDYAYNRFRGGVGMNLWLPYSRLRVVTPGGANMASAVCPGLSLRQP